MAKTNRDYLYDILDSAGAALEYVRGMSYEEFRHDLRTRDAVVRRLEIVGEATRRLEDSFKNSIPEIPWRKIIGFRNIVAHEYDKVELRVVWRILQDDLSQLASLLRVWLEKNPQE